LIALGFSRNQVYRDYLSCAAPAMVFPMHTPDGEKRSPQIKPDNPRLDKDGDVVKYESVPRRRKSDPIPVYCPPAVRGRVMDTTEPLVLTEGVKTALSLASRGVTYTWCTTRM
jgi:hypothetical protein